MKRLIVVSFLLLFSLLSLQSFASEDHSDMHDVMAHLLTPASEKIWNASGFIITEEGELSLAPTNQEEWNEVIFGAKVIMESTFILNRPDRSQGRSDWISFLSYLNKLVKKLLKQLKTRTLKNFSKLVQIYIKHVSLVIMST